METRAEISVIRTLRVFRELMPGQAMIRREEHTVAGESLDGLITAWSSNKDLSLTTRGVCPCERGE